MPGSDLAGVITASAAVLTALALVITSVATLVATRRAGRKLDVVHTLVNSQHTDLVKYQDDLVKALQSADVKVPQDQSIVASERPAP